MPVPLETPVVIPERQAVTATLRWLSTIAISCPDGPGREGNAFIESLPLTAGGALVPKDADGRDMMESLHLRGNLFRCCQEVPQAKAIMDAILAGYEPIKAWIAAQQPSGI